MTRWPCRDPPCLGITVLKLEAFSLYGDSEKTLGKWFKRTGKRDEIFLATKFGFVKGSTTFATDSSAEYTKKCCHASLEALGIETIDLCKLCCFTRS